jgi:hypothetical protein
MVEFYTNGCNGKTAARYFWGTEIEDRWGWPGQPTPRGGGGRTGAPVIEARRAESCSSAQQNYAEDARMFAGASCATIGAAGR